MSNIQKEILTFSYNGVIQENKNVFLFKSITDQLKNLTQAKGVLISLSGIEYDEDLNGFALLVRQINSLSQKIDTSIGFIDYSLPLYKILKTLTKNTSLKLFKNGSAARLFLDSKSFKEGIQVLVYDDDLQNSQKLSQELSHYGYSVTLAKNLADFQQFSSEKRHDVIVTHSTLNLGLSSSNPQKKALSLSKNLIANLPVFMDTAVETLISFTGLDAQKSAHSIKSFDVSLTSDIICSVMRFSGDLEGSFVLVFPKGIAITAIESILGEKVAQDDMDTIMDGVSEFCNIITGSIKTVLSGKDIKVIFNLPKTFTSLQATLGDIGEQSGIWIDMQLNGNPFYMFITK
ncbi:chemotaxis protein CheX [bacterium]|nr:chemotaxis protein CheX [bacterium]